jgi:hypothetical protein
MIDLSYKTKINKSPLVHKTFTKVNQKKEELCQTNSKKSKILIIGDSHARGCASNLSSHLGKDTDVMGTVMPGSRLEHIVKTNIKDIRTLEKKDAVIISGGSMDINKNEAEFGLRQLKKLVDDAQNTNILIVTANHRYDLQESSCVNKEIASFNRKLKKVMKTKDNVKIVQPNLDRNDFTRHGMHLNVSGKDKTAELIIQTLKLFDRKREKSPIVIKWVETETAKKQNKLKDKAPNPCAHLEWKLETEKNPTERVNIMLQNDPIIRKSTRLKKSSKDVNFLG